MLPLYITCYFLIICWFSLILSLYGVLVFFLLAVCFLSFFVFFFFRSLCCKLSLYSETLPFEVFRSTIQSSLNRQSERIKTHKLSWVSAETLFFPFKVLKNIFQWLCVWSLASWNRRLEVKSIIGILREITKKPIFATKSFGI